MWLYISSIIWILFLNPSESLQIRAGIDYCQLKGSVYIEEFPAYADILIYEESSEAFADMLVYETESALFADKPGLWFFVDKKAFADFTIGFVDRKQNADITIYFTSFESFAGCNK
jgi:hypothetical protein